MKKVFFALFGIAIALSISAEKVGEPTSPLARDGQIEQNLRLAKAPTVPSDLYVEPGTHSCVVTWNDEDNSAWNLRYRLYSEDPVLLHSLNGSSYTGSYADVTLPAPWGGVNTRAGNGAIYVKNNYNGVARGTLTYTIPEGYSNDFFTLLITSGTGTYGTGNFTVYTPQTADVGHYFSGGETYKWLVKASSGEKITVYSTDQNYSPDIALIAVYSGDATEMKLMASGWNYANNLDKTTYTIEDLETETDYEVQVQAIGNDGSLSDWTRSDVFTTLAEEPIIPVVHILGDIDNQAWSPSVGTKMEYDAENELYTATIYVEADRTFGFSTELDDNGDMGGWNYLLPYRFGPVSNDGIFVLTNEYMGQSLPLTFDNYGDIRILSSGEYSVTVSLEENYIIVGKIGGIEHEYMVGDVNHNGSVTISDVTDLIDYLSGATVNVCEICADVNGNGEITIADVTLLIDNLLIGD